jgi:hypothetical protein
MSLPSRRALPTAADEATDPAAADRRYAYAVTTLRTLTQKAEDFPRVAAENANYGFRRSTLGLKGWAQLLAVAVTAGSVTLALTSGGVRFVVPAFLAAAAGLLWTIAVTPTWVRPAADRYADRLVEAVEILRRDRQAP